MRGATPDHPRLPWSGITPLSAQTSYEGAQDATKRADVQLWSYLRALRTRGEHGLTDLEAAALLGIERTSICARRNWLAQRGFVRASGRTRPGPTGVRNVVWIAG